MPPTRSTRRAVLYGRVSRLAAGDRAGEGKSVDQQLTELTRIAEREHVQVVATHRDDGISASRYAKGKQREGWQDVLGLIAAGDVTELWVWELSRATRDREVYSALVSTCAARQVLIVIGGRVHDPNDPDDGFMLDLQGALATRESALTSKRILRDVSAAAEKGRPHGRITYGYAREYDPHTRAIARQYPDPDTGPIVAEIVRRVGAGEAGYSIALDLQARGVPSPQAARAARLGQQIDHPRPWGLEEVHRIAVNPAYAGRRVHHRDGETTVTAAVDWWEPIVTFDEHARAVARLAQPGRRTWSDASTKHLLTGIARCGVCTGPVKLIKNRGYLSYTCGTRGCMKVSRVQGPVDLLVRDVIVGWAEEPDILERLAAGQDDTEALDAARELVELRNRWAAYAASAAAGRISLDMLEVVEGPLREQIADAERRAVPRHTSPEVSKLVGPGALHRWEHDLTPTERRRIVRELLEVTILRSPHKRGRRGFDPDLVDVQWRDPNLAGPGGA